MTSCTRTLDRVASRTVAGPLGAVTGVFAYAGVSGDPAAGGDVSFARGPGGELLAAADGAGAVVAGSNRHGDLTGLFDGSGGLVASRVYEPFGGVAGRGGDREVGVGFQGDVTDPDSGAVWMGARWYDPAVGRFTARDSVFGQLGSPVSLNRYGYGNGSPLRFADPDGRVAIDSVDQRARQGSRRTAADRATDAAFAKTMRLVRRARALGIDPNRFTAERGERSLRWAVARATVAQRCAPACDWGGRGEWSFGLDNLTEALKYATNGAVGVVDESLSALEETVNTGIFAAEGLAQIAQFRIHRGNVHSDDLIRFGRLEAGRIGPVFKDPYALKAYDSSRGVTLAATTLVGIVAGGPSAVSRLPRLARGFKGLRSTLRRTASAGDDHAISAARSVTPFTERQIGTTMDDLLEEAQLLKQSTSTQYTKSGGFDQANLDFDALTRGLTVVDRGGGLRTATSSNGTKVNVRPFSSGKYPTLEVATPGNPFLKIRY